MVHSEQENNSCVLQERMKGTMSSGTWLGVGMDGIRPVLSVYDTIRGTINATAMYWVTEILYVCLNKLLSESRTLGEC